MSEILVVDDERSMREFLEIMLGQAGEQVRTASSVAEAGGLIEERKPDLVITDLRMKGGSGLDLLRQTKQSQNGKEGSQQRHARQIESPIRITLYEEHLE